MLSSVHVIRDLLVSKPIVGFELPNNYNLLERLDQGKIGTFIQIGTFLQS